MKRILAFILATVIIMGGVGPIFSYSENAYDKKLESAILKSKKLFNISDKHDKFTSSIGSHQGATSFNLSWSDSEEKLDNINVNIDSEGNIISYNTDSPIYKELDTRLATYSREELLKMAMDFIEKIDPKISEEIKIMPSSGISSPKEEDYNFNFRRYINDIGFNENYINININKYTGEVTYFYSNWDRKLEFPSAEKVISLEEAKTSYKSEIGLKPIYKTDVYNYRKLGLQAGNKDPRYYLAYSILGNNKGIDALTGKKIDLNYSRAYYSDDKQKVMAEDMAGGLTPEEQISVDKVTGLMDLDDADKRAREILDLDNSFKIQDNNLYPSYKNTEEYIWSISFTKEATNEGIISVNISLDAKSGKLLSFYKSKNHELKTTAKIDNEVALNIAKEYIKKINPDQEIELELSEDQEISGNQISYYLPSYYFKFDRKTNGLYVEGDGINLGIDGVDGEVFSYSLDWYNGEFPSTDKMISIDKAYEVLWNKIGLNLRYVKVYDQKKPEGENIEVKLVYLPNPDKPTIISGINGELLDYRGKPYVESKEISYDDIDKSYAKDKIKTLAEYGIGFQDEQFKPKDKIKQKDFIYLLWKSMNSYSTDSISEDNIYKEFIGMGYMTEEEKNPNKIITKEEGIKIILKMMRFEKVAEIDGIYGEIFKDEKDISKGMKGYINIGYGLKIILGDGSGNIKPKQELKREEAANMIYNYLFN